MADSKSSKPVHAADGRAIAEDAGVEGKVQRRSDPDESGVDETIQTVRHQSSRWLFANDDSNPSLFRSLQNAGPGGGIAERKISLGKGSFPAGHNSAPATARLAREYHSSVHGCHSDLADGDDAKNRRSDSAPRDDVHAADLFIYLLQFCRGSGIVLHRTEPFQHLAILSE